MKQAMVWCRGLKAGILTEDENGYTFVYDADYLASSEAEAVSLTLSLREEPYHDKVLFPFFDGLIPEGWLLDIAEKNFSLYSKERGIYTLTPAYDMLSTTLVMPEDTEELALTLNGKKRKLKKADFATAMQASGLEDKVIDNIFNKFLRVKDKWLEFIGISFLPDEMKEGYKSIIEGKLRLLE